MDIEKARKILEGSQQPMFIFDDDPDGLSAFLLLYKYVNKGNFLIVKSKPVVDDKFVAMVKQYTPDLIVVLDVPNMEQSFVRKVGLPVIWIDHHQPKALKGVFYLNPHLVDKNYCTTHICYMITNKDVWIAGVGIISDWQIPPREFSEKYPHLLKDSITNPGEALHDAKGGMLARVFSTVLKGPIDEVYKRVKLLMKIESPDEILEKKSKAGEKIYEHFLAIESEYRKLYDLAVKEIKEDSKLIVFIYEEEKISMSSELSNELLYRNPGKVVIVGREKEGEIRMSLRSSDIKIRPILNKAMEEVDGYGGGHEMACGACVKKPDFDKFLTIIESQI